MNRIKELRTAAGMKQSDLADRLKLVRTVVSKYELGQVDLSTETIAKLCQIFHVTADYLLGLSSQRTAQISDADAALVDAYHAAPDSIRTAIDSLLQPYQEQETSTASPAAGE